MPLLDVSPEFAADLVDTVRQVLREPETLRQVANAVRPFRGWYLAATPGGGIAGMTNDTPSSATCQIYALNKSTGQLEVAEGKVGGINLTEDVFHAGELPVAGNTYIQCTQDFRGVWWTVWEDCPEEGQGGETYASDILNDSGVGGTPKP